MGYTMGQKGLKAIALNIHQNTMLLAEGLKQLGFVQKNSSFFDTLLVELGNVSKKVDRSF